MNNLVKINNLHYHRNGRVIFRGLDIAIPQGKVTAIMGPSGAGKTTLLRLIGGQLTPTQGEVFVDQQNVHRLKHHELYALRKRMGLLFQSGGLFTHLNVFENVAYGLRRHFKLSESEISQRVKESLNLVGMGGSENK